MTQPELLTALFHEARAAGFDDVGACPVDVGQPYRAELARAFDEGRLDPFAWMHRTRDQRLDPRVRMPKANSVVVVVHSYYRGDHDADVDAGKITRYAWGADYHHVMRRKLRRLRTFLLQRAPGATVAPFNDVDAVTERAWAVACGLGFIGKSSMFISKKLGTWTFLGGLLTDLDLCAEIPVRVTDGCGQCTRCLDACPTGALTAPMTVDARRCLTTWSVESPTDVIGDQFAGSGWAVGCDICQEVCPWNKRAVISSEPRYTRTHTHLHEHALPTADDIKGTPLARPGHDNLLHLAKRAKAPRGPALRPVPSHDRSKE